MKTESRILERIVALHDLICLLEKDTRPWQIDMKTAIQAQKQQLEWILEE